MIEITNVSKTYTSSGVKSLDGIDLEVDDASILGLIGTNGAGKSTLLRIVSGVYRPDTGKVKADGKPVYENPKVKEKIAFLSDEHYFLRSANLEQNANFYKRFYPDFSEEYFTKLTNSFGLNRKAPLVSFSKGMLRQCEVILALSSMPRYILCDETFDGLDPSMRAFAKRELMSYAAENGATVILSSHNMFELEDLCDRIALINSGRLMLNCGIDELKEKVYTYQTVIEDLPETVELPDIRIYAQKRRGKMYTFTAQGQPGDIETVVRNFCAQNGCKLTYFEPVTLSLDEIFRYEVESRGYGRMIGGAEND